MFPEDISVLSMNNFTDNRGCLSVIYESDNVGSLALKRSFSKKGVFRGMHYQKPPFDQRKVIQVLSGIIFDVVINMDLNSKFFGHIYGRKINSDDGEVFEIPEYYAHGFIALTDVVFQYLTLGQYSAESEISISLPLDYLEANSIDYNSFIISDKDRSSTPYELYFADFKSKY